MTQWSKRALCKCYTFGENRNLACQEVRLYLHELQFWSESCLDLPVSLTIPSAVKGDFLDTYSYEKKGILTCEESGYK